MEFCEDLASVGDAIIAGVKRATNDNISVIMPDDSTESAGSKRANPEASSGGVGEFIKNHRQKCG